MNLNIAILSGDGIGPEIIAPVDFAVRMIYSADLSRSLWSYAFKEILIKSLAIYEPPSDDFDFINFSSTETGTLAYSWKSMWKFALPWERDLKSVA